MVEAEPATDGRLSTADGRRENRRRRASSSRPAPGRAAAVAARRGAAAGAPGEGRDPHPARPRRARPLRADRRRRARLPRPARGRPPDRRRDGGGARVRHRGDRGRGARAAPRGLPGAARDRRAGAGRGARRPAPGHPRQRARDRPRRRGLVLATGHYRNGVLLAPATAEAVAALLCGRGAPAVDRPFSPPRFAVGPEPPRPARRWPDEDRAQRRGRELADGATVADAVRRPGADSERRGARGRRRRRGRAARRVGCDAADRGPERRGRRRDPGRRRRRASSSAAAAGARG